jgi:hypothetical protein
VYRAAATLTHQSLGVLVEAEKLHQLSWKEKVDIMEAISNHTIFPSSAS